MGNSIIHHHPSLTHAQDLRDICKPLNILNINYFAHVNITRDGEFSGMNNNAAFSEHYLKKRYYNADIHMNQTNSLGEQIIWDALECDAETDQLNIEAKAFGVDHTFTLVNKNPDSTDYYHFSSNLLGFSINQEYLRHLDLLKLFIQHFHEQVRQSRALLRTYDMKFMIDDQPTGFNIKQHAQDN